MEFDWTTFGLEVLNFLVLVWLLKRFFYRPVLAVIERRRVESENVVAAAEAMRNEARTLKADYETRLAHAAEERDRALAALADEMAAERTRRLAAVQNEVDAERQRRQTLEIREREERDTKVEREALTVAARFAARLLDRLASPELEDRLVELTVAELRAMVPETRAALRAALDTPEMAIRVTTAHQLDPSRRTALSAELNAVAGRDVAPEFREDPALKAGVSIEAGSWVLMANLRDELQYFGANPDHDQ